MTNQEVIERALQCAKDAHDFGLNTLAVNDYGDIYMVISPTKREFYLADDIEASRKLIKSTFLDWYNQIE